MSYPVYRVQYNLAMQDPFMLGKRYHNVIFVATNADGSGWVHHVTGDIVQSQGMTYERKPGREPDLSATFHSKTLIGYVREEGYPVNMDRILQSVPTPPRQRNFNPHTMRYEPCKPDGTFYAPNESHPPYWKCTEWTQDKAIPALRQYLLIQ